MRRAGVGEQWRVELSTNLRGVSHCSEKVPTRAFTFTMLKSPTSAFTIKNLFKFSGIGKTGGVY